MSNIKKANNTYGFVPESKAYKQLMKEIASRKPDNSVTTIPGGHLINRMLHNNALLNAPALDMLGGVGQYKVPQRALGALLGARVLREDDRELSALGAVGGYAASAGLEHGIRHMRGKELDEILHGLESYGTLKDVDERDMQNALDKLIGKLRKKDLQGAIYADLPIGNAIYNTPANTSVYISPGGARTVDIKYSGDLLDPEALNRLEHSMRNRIESIKDFPGFSKSKYLKGLEAGFDEVLYRQRWLKEIGIDAKTMRESGLDKLIKAHEAAEVVSLLDNRKPFRGGSLNEAARAALRTDGIYAEHASPAVLLQEGDLAARVGSKKTKELMNKMRKATGEESFLRHVRGGASGDLVVGDKYIKNNADTIADILKIYLDEKNTLPEKALLNRVRVNPMSRALSHAGRGLSSLEHALATALKSALKLKK